MYHSIPDCPSIKPGEFEMEAIVFCFFILSVHAEHVACVGRDLKTHKPMKRKEQAFSWQVKNCIYKGSPLPALPTLKDSPTTPTRVSPMKVLHLNATRNTVIPPSPQRLLRKRHERQWLGQRWHVDVFVSYVVSALTTPGQCAHHQVTKRWPVCCRLRG